MLQAAVPAGSTRWTQRAPEAASSAPHQESPKPGNPGQKVTPPYASHTVKRRIPVLFSSKVCCQAEPSLSASGPCSISRGRGGRRGRPGLGLTGALEATVRAPRSRAELLSHSCSHAPPCRRVSGVHRPPAVLIGHCLGVKRCRDDLVSNPTSGPTQAALRSLTGSGPKPALLFPDAELRSLGQLPCPSP